MYKILDENGIVMGVLLKGPCDGYNILEVLKEAEYDIELAKDPEMEAWFILNYARTYKENHF